MYLETCSSSNINIPKLAKKKYKVLYREMVFYDVPV